MARNAEKSNSMFSRWAEFKKNNGTKPGGKPLISSDCTSLPEAEQWRRDVVRDITKKVTAIANAALGESRIRELNDEINKLMKKKYFWESRIVELGGTDHRKTRQYYDIEGKELPGARGYRYYGAAKELPGVRELFQQKDNEAEAQQQRKRRTRGDIHRFITPDYYGFRDEDDGVLLVKEAAREAELVQEEQRAWQEKKRKLEAEVKRSGGVFGSKELALMDDGAADAGNGEETVGQAAAAAAAASVGVGAGAGLEAGGGVAVPTRESIDEQIVASKKAALLASFL